MLEGGADLRFVQQMLGPASLKATSIYTHVSIAQLKKVTRAHAQASKMPGALLAGREGRGAST